jgi:hypothetical protein
MPDNEIKLFAAGGQKLPDELEERIDQAMTHAGTGWWTGPPPAMSAGCGCVPQRLSCWSRWTMEAATEEPAAGPI